MSRRFQFSLRALFQATSLLALAVTLAKALPDCERESWPFCLFGETACIAPAIGALRGRAMGGAGAGLVIAFFILLLSYW